MDIFGIPDPDPHKILCGSETLASRRGRVYKRETSQTHKLRSGKKPSTHWTLIDGGMQKREWHHRLQRCPQQAAAVMCNRKAYGVFTTKAKKWECRKFTVSDYGIWPVDPHLFFADPNPASFLIRIRIQLTKRCTKYLIKSFCSRNKFKKTQKRLLKSKNLWRMVPILNTITIITQFPCIFLLFFFNFTLLDQDPHIERGSESRRENESGSTALLNQPRWWVGYGVSQLQCFLSLSASWDRTLSRSAQSGNLQTTERERINVIEGGLHDPDIDLDCGQISDQGLQQPTGHNSSTRFVTTILDT